MIDSKTVQEVQKELIAAVHRGQEQVRKGQERVRKGQEQVRKSREAVVGTVSELAKAVLPSIPAGTVRLPTPTEARAHARDIATQAMTLQRDLAGKAWHAAGPYAERVKATRRDVTERALHAVPYAERLVAVQRDLAERARLAGVAEQVSAAQRTLAERVSEAAKVATPLVAEGRARLSQVIGARPEASKAAADGADNLAEVREMVVKDETAAPAKAAPKAKAAAPRAKTVKASTPKATTARRATTAKPRTPKS